MRRARQDPTAPVKIRLRGAYIIKAAESFSQRIEAKAPPAGWQPPAPSARDRALARAVLRAKTGV